MLSRYALRSVCIFPFKLSRAFGAKLHKTGLTNNIICNNGSISSAVNPLCQYQFYSTQVALEDMIVTYEEVKKATMDDEICIVDVREPDEIKEYGKIPNSINIPLGEVTKVLSTMTDSEFIKTYSKSKPTEDSPLIFYCMIGKRSGMAQQNALNLGYKNVKNYLGSWTDWAAKSQ